jgi:hypothetical protein
MIRLTLGIDAPEHLWVRPSAIVAIVSHSDGAGHSASVHVGQDVHYVVESAEQILELIAMWEGGYGNPHYDRIACHVHRMAKGLRDALDLPLPLGPSRSF